MLIVRLATDADFRDFFHADPPAVWTGLCGERDGAIVGIGGVVYSEDGVAVAFLDTKERPGMTLHRAGLRFMAAMREVGEPIIYTAADETLSRAADWLMRLGFKMTPDIIDGRRIMTWRP